MLKRALLVGLDTYAYAPALGGCVNDVEALCALLGRNEDGSPNFACHSLTSAEEVTRVRLIESVQALLGSGADVALLYFAGHGAARRGDVVLTTYEGREPDPGVSLSQVLGLVQASPVREVIVVLDCCFAGEAGGVPQFGGEAAVLRPGVSLLTASRGDQEAMETEDGRGAFSLYLCGALSGGAADVLGKVTLAGVYAYLSESFGAWDQRPTFKANVDRLSELRCCTPSVPVSDLRQLAELFPTPDHVFPLDPSYEPLSDTEHPERHAVFALLQRCRAAKLVDPVGTEHMYFAAMQRLGCRLTPLGQHYRRLDARGLL